MCRYTLTRYVQRAAAVGRARGVTGGEGLSLVCKALHLICAGYTSRGHIFGGDEKKKKKEGGQNGHTLALQIPETADQKGPQLESMSFGLHYDIRDGSSVFPKQNLNRRELTIIWGFCCIYEAG